jgi:hypothetical protein
MHRDDLIEYLKGLKDPSELRKKIYHELGSFRKSLKVKGGSSNVYYDGDCERTFIGSKEIRRLCLDFLNKNVDEFFVSYIADALLLSENTVYESEHVREQLELLTDFEVNGHLSLESVKGIYQNLS